MAVGHDLSVSSQEDIPVNEKASPIEKWTTRPEGTIDDVFESELVADWTASEERIARLKVDFSLLPVVALAFFALQIDRGNISNVLTTTITTDVGITTNQINVGTQLLSAGIVILELPSNILLQKIGPQKWLSIQIFAWGMVATFQAFITNYAGYLVTRILLGLCESGFIPGALYYISTWYKTEETSTRFTYFYIGQMISSATSSLMASGILKLSGKCGLEGWQWIFLIEGLISVLAGILFFLLLPPHVGDGRPLLSKLTGGRWSYYTDREAEILRNRVLIDDPKKAKGKIQITKSDITQTLKSLTLWQHGLITLVSMSAVQGFGQYAPTLIKSFGFGTIKANAMASVYIWCAIIWALLMSLLSDKFNRRGPFVLLSITWNAIGYSCLNTLPDISDKWHKYGTLTAVGVSYASVHFLNVSWLSVKCKTPQQRSVAMAFIIMAANLSGISGSQIFRTEDAPAYKKALVAIASLSGAAWVLVLALCLQYLYMERTAQTGSPSASDSEEIEQ
ncbi:major facilitator superfamily domain-containing protein [Penicillium malachiteum]|uniref:Major facilitator superfamily domain-containing protein n=1 Tax=Penicillium malachiteum TaxID=1324776 RepID=A0AAD6MUS0_9EURO|nr:major facilitator superfamily domain-containing protein [Penicillium malachiteum]